MMRERNLEIAEREEGWESRSRFAQKWGWGIKTNGSKMFRELQAEQCKSNTQYTEIKGDIGVLEVNSKGNSHPA